MWILLKRNIQCRLCETTRVNLLLFVNLTVWTKDSYKLEYLVGHSDTFHELVM